MKTPAPQLIGNVLIGLVAVVLLLAGLLKLIGVGAEDMVEGLEKAHLIQHVHLICVAAIVCGLLLLIPKLKMLGVLMASSYWGGAIVAHLTYDDSFAMPAVFLALLWLGAWLSGHVSLPPAEHKGESESGQSA